MDTATNTVVENRLVPMNRKPDQGHNQLTGQSILNWVRYEEAEGIVRWSMFLNDALNLTGEQLDKVCRDATSLAYVGDGETRRKADDYGTIANRGTLLRMAVGCIKQGLSVKAKVDGKECLKTLTEADFAELGINSAEKLSRQALKENGVNWKGDKVDTASKERKASAKAHGKAVSDLMAEGATLAEATAKAAERVQKAADKDAATKAIKVLEAAIKKCGDLGFDGTSTVALMASVAGVIIVIED
jgi:hypothetical protein